MPAVVRSKGQRGFSLPEALIVITVSLVMVALTGKSMLSAVENYRVISAARQLTATVQVAHLKAPSQATRYRVRIDSAARTWVLERFDRSSSTWATEAGSAPETLPPQVNFSISGITAVPPEQSAVTQASETTFNSMSFLCDTSTSQPVDGRCFYLQGNSDRPAAVCTTMVGRTAVYRLDGGAWNLQ